MAGVNFNPYKSASELKVCLLHVLLALYPNICLCFVLLYKLDCDWYTACIRSSMGYGLWFFVINAALNLYYAYELKKAYDIVFRRAILFVVTFLLFAVIWCIMSVTFNLGSFLLNVLDHFLLYNIVIIIWLFLLYVSMYYFLLATRNKFAWISSFLRVIAIVCFLIAAGMLSNPFKEFHLGNRGDIMSFYFHSYYALPVLLLAYTFLSLVSTLCWSFALYRAESIKVLYKRTFPVLCVLFSYLFLYFTCLVASNRIANTMEDISAKYYSAKSINYFEEMHDAFRNDLIARVNSSIEGLSSASFKKQFLSLQDLQTHQDELNALCYLQAEDICIILKEHFSFLSKCPVYFRRYYIPFCLDVISKNITALHDEKHKELLEDLIAFLSDKKDVLSDIYIDVYFITYERILFSTRYPDNDDVSVFIDYGILQRIYPAVPLSYYLWKQKLIKDRHCPGSFLLEGCDNSFSAILNRIQRHRMFISGECSE